VEASSSRSSGKPSSQSSKPQEENMKGNRGSIVIEIIWEAVKAII
jgi:hypothetical protein